MNESDNSVACAAKAWCSLFVLAKDLQSWVSPQDLWLIAANKTRNEIDHLVSQLCWDSQIPSNILNCCQYSGSTMI